MAYWSRSNSFATRFPRDIQREILLRLPYDDILRLEQDDAFTWIGKDAEYWAQRANVERCMFADTTEEYHWLYLKLKYESMATELLAPTLRSYGVSVTSIHWVNVLFKVLLNPAMSSDDYYEFARYVFGIYDDWINIVNGCLRSIARHPKILKWIASTGVRIPIDRSAAIVAAYESEGMSGVHCLESITDKIDWIYALAVDAYKHIELIQYIVKINGAKNSALYYAYVTAARDGYEDVASYLKPMVSDPRVDRVV